jgi:hypothetical protein
LRSRVLSAAASARLQGREERFLREIWRWRQESVLAAVLLVAMHLGLTTAVERWWRAHGAFDRADDRAHAAEMRRILEGDTIP